MSLDKTLLNRHFVPAKGFDTALFETKSNDAPSTSQSNFSPDEVSLFYQSVVNTPSTSTSTPQHDSQLSQTHFNDKDSTPTPSANPQTKPRNTSARLQRRFLAAAQHGDLSDLIFCIESGVDMNCLDSFSWSALMVAAFAGHRSLVETLLEYDADVTITESKGLTARDLAVRNGRESIVTCLDNFVYRQTDNFSYHQEESIVKGEPEVDDSDDDDQPLQYCNVCRSEFTESWHLHSNSLLHQMEENRSSSSHNLGIDGSVLLPPRNRGYKLLVKEGWIEGSGLGPQGEGRKAPIKTILKRDRLGLGKGKPRPARISHFNPSDAKAVESVNEKPLTNHIQIDNKYREKRIRIEKGKEKNFRMQFYSCNSETEVGNSSRLLYGGK